METKKFLNNDELLTHLIGCFAESVFSAFSDDGRVYDRAKAFYAKALAAQDVYTNREVWVAAHNRYPETIRMPQEDEE